MVVKKGLANLCISSSRQDAIVCTIQFKRTLDLSALRQVAADGCSFMSFIDCGPNVVNGDQCKNCHESDGDKGNNESKHEVRLSEKVV